MRKVSKYFAIFFILSLLIFYLVSCTSAPGENSGSTGGNGYTGKIRLNIVLQLPSFQALIPQPSLLETQMRF